MVKVTLHSDFRPSSNGKLTCLLRWIELNVRQFMNVMVGSQKFTLDAYVHIYR